MKKLKKLISLTFWILFLFLCFNSYLVYKVPIKYEYFVDSAVQETGVDKALVLAIIKTESRFDRFSVSNKGAVGLMQIMPTTAVHIADKYKLKLDDPTELEDVYTNIKIGTIYIDELLNRFGSEKLALAAYNAGPKNVQEWINEGIITSNDTGATPFYETRNYVDKVMSAKAGYKKFLKYKYRVPKFFTDFTIDIFSMGNEFINKLKNIGKVAEIFR